MLYEVCKKSIRINKVDEHYITWQNDILAVRVDEGIQFFHFIYNVNSLDKELNFNVSFIPNTNNSPAQGLFPDTFVRNKMTNLDYTEMAIDSGYYPHNPQLTRDMAYIRTFIWSPPDMIDYSSILAVLNNVGGVQLFLHESHTWQNLLDFSSKISTHYEDYLILRLKSFDDLKNNVDMVETSSIQWGRKCGHGVCYFLTGQKNGDILIWRIKCVNKETSADIVGELKTGLGEIITMLWIDGEDSNLFNLICSNDLGQMSAYSCKITSDGVQLLKEVCLWSHQDRMIPNIMHCQKVGVKTIVFCNKHRHLVVLLLDNNCTVLSQIVKNINDFRITSIFESNNGFYLSTVNNKLYKINLTIDNGILTADCSLLEFKDSYKDYELYGVSTSHNRLIWVAAMISRKVLFRKNQFYLELTFLCEDLQLKTELDLLLNNHTEKLVTQWDCIEMLRFKTIKQKQLPSIDYHNLYTEGYVNLNKMRLYLIFVTLYNNVENILRNGPKPELPETSISVVKENIVILYAAELITELHDISKSNKMKPFELETFAATRHYLEWYCKENKRLMSEIVSPEVISVVKQENTYTCQVCDETIEGITCKDGHINLFCSLTFTPIESDDYLVCRGCNSIARIELFSNKPMCLFCDVPLVKVYIM